MPCESVSIVDIAVLGIYLGHGIVSTGFRSVGWGGVGLIKSKSLA